MIDAIPTRAVESMTTPPMVGTSGFPFLYMSLTTYPFSFRLCAARPVRAMERAKAMTIPVRPPNSWHNASRERPGFARASSLRAYSEQGSAWRSSPLLCLGKPVIHPAAQWMRGSRKLVQVSSKIRESPSGESGIRTMLARTHDTFSFSSHLRHIRQIPFCVRVLSTRSPNPAHQAGRRPPGAFFPVSSKDS